MEVAALNMLNKNSSIQSAWIARGAHSFMSAVWGGTQKISDYFSLASRNRELAEENFHLRSALARLEASPRDSVISAGPETIRNFEYINAEVVKISRGKQHNYLIVSKGYEDGVKEKSGVITDKGVIGIVEEVSAHHAFALSFQNADISISTRLGTEGAVGPLIWDGRTSRGGILKEIPLQYRYEKGDTVYTSGFSSIFPPDIPLGIAGDSKVVNGATNDIAVTLLEDFSAVRYVTLVHNLMLEELEGFAQ